MNFNVFSNFYCFYWLSLLPPSPPLLLSVSQRRFRYHVTMRGRTKSKYLMKHRHNSSAELHTVGAFTHREARGAYTGTCDRMAVSSISAAARQNASLSIVSRWASLITVKPRPSCRASAFARKWVAAKT